MPQRKMSTFINSGNSSNKTVVANNNNNESNCNEMGIDGGNPNSSFSCAYSTAAPSIDDRPPTGPTGKQQFLELPNSMLVNNKATQDHGATDSGRESVNEFDSSLEDTQLSKKPCTADFYTTGRASSSQTKWFVDFKHGNEITAAETVALEEIPATVIALEDVANVGSACNKTAAAVNDEHRSWRIEQSNENLSFSENEGKITTTKNPKIDRINAIGVRSIYSSDYQRLDPVLSNLAHQLRAVSSPSLTEVTQDAALVRTATTVTTSSMLTPSLSPTKAAAAAASSSTSSSSAKTTIILPAADAAYGAIKSSSSHTLHPVAAAQNVGVLQKFKRTFSNFNRNQQQQQQLPSSTTIMLPTPAGFSVTSAEDGGGGGGGGDALQYKANKRSASAGTAAAAAAAESQSADQFAGKCRFGPLIWRSSKERRKAKCNRRDKCNSGDSGIQIELENDEQFAPVVTGQSDAASSGCREPAITSYRSRIRRVNSAKASSNSCSNSGEGKDGRDSGSATASSPLTASLSPPSGHGYKTLEEIDAYDWCVAAPTSLPARSLSQPTGLDRLVVPPHTRTHADPEESDTDSVSSSHQDCNEANDRHRPLFAEVLYNFTSAGPQELSLQRGDLVEILRKEIGPWWYGRKRSDGVIGTTATLFEPQLGWFPKDFVRIMLLSELDDFDYPLQQQQQHRQQQQRTMASKPSSPALDNTLIAATDSGSEITIAGDSCASRHNNVTTIVIDPASEADSTLVLCHSETQETDTVTVTVTIVPTSPQSPGVLHDNTNIMRNSAVQELYHTEVNYVKLLSAICRGYLPTMSKRIDIFPPDSIRLIFSNIESIFKFQQQFLEALRSGIERNMIARVFLEHQSGFLVYSTYCNSYPRALIELETYSRNKDARTIMENCRLAEDLPELPLSAHLLAPVQRICRYPLHLAELIKNCCSKSSDEAVAVKDEVDSSLHRTMDTKESLESALKAMKNVTEAVNEGKRHSENLARHQSNFENFSGPPLHFHSTRYFMQIDATRVSPNLWNNTYTLFLFDHQLIYCKKDILKRQHFIYKGRIFLDSCRILNLPDGKIFGATVKNALRIYCDTRNKWFDFSFRSANRKRRFLTTLALERQFCGKNLFISELAASDETTDERDLSDREYHSDYETTVSGRRSRRDNGVGETGPHLVSGGGGGGDVVGETSCSSLDLHCKENVYDVVGGGGGGSSGGSSSLPESPSKQQHKFCDTLPKHATRHTSHTSTATTVTTNGGGKDLIYDYSTSSLGRRRLGNWFRKSKSTNSTPNQSPTHQPLVLGGAMQLNSDSSSLSSPALGGCKSKELTSSASS